ncbi:esterase-like activity of phytase family protein [Geothrix sp. PMB-07]|uniref:esterase-like activity of phytase family protein n=1 Tax=Geothrix sp. PMB-07 TaxID=3068640 RepID=UPI002741A440|nr:esterase-like activity of phytase family protein [Geothrix sp. PMB-07]WLT30361.1 esterase-like activity of phytase family protein [Geothrix sp. PMB-07]
MTPRSLLPLLLVALAAAQAQAQVKLIAIGSLSGQYEDLAHVTAPALENGIPGNRLGGLGSGLAYAGGTTFLALPDRGPNAKAYNSAVDDTASYIPRFHTLDLSLAPSDPGSPLPFVLTPSLRDTTLLSSSQPLVYGTGKAYGLPGGAPALNTRHTFYFSGRSDNFDATRPSTHPLNGRLDPEGIRVSRDGRSVFISDEYGPFLYQFDRHSGRRVRAFQLPAKFAVHNLSPRGDVEISGNTAGRVANKGMEGLAITPDGRTLVGAMQSPLLQDGGTNAPFIRLVAVNLRTGATREYAYELTNIGTAAKPKYPTVSELLAINEHEFLVDERDGKGLGDGSAAGYKRIYRIDLNGAQDVSGLIGAANLAGKAVTKSLFLDVVAALGAQGYSPEQIPAKLEGLAFGPDVQVDGTSKHTLFLANDNDFSAVITDSLHPTGAANPNQFFVFAFSDNELPGFAPQRFCGEEADRDED